MSVTGFLCVVLGGPLIGFLLGLLLSPDLMDDLMWTVWPDHDEEAEA